MSGAQSFKGTKPTRISDDPTADRDLTESGWLVVTRLIPARMPAHRMPSMPTRLDQTGKRFHPDDEDRSRHRFCNAAEAPEAHGAWAGNSNSSRDLGAAGSLKSPRIRSLTAAQRLQLALSMHNAQESLLDRKQFSARRVLSGGAELRAPFQGRHDGIDIVHAPTPSTAAGTDQGRPETGVGGKFFVRG